MILPIKRPKSNNLIIHPFNILFMTAKTTQIKDFATINNVKFFVWSITTYTNTNIVSAKTDKGVIKIDANTKITFH